MSPGTWSRVHASRCRQGPLLRLGPTQLPQGKTWSGSPDPSKVGPQSCTLPPAVRCSLRGGGKRHAALRIAFRQPPAADHSVKLVQEMHPSCLQTH